MKACKHPGKCSLCGEYKELTFEHVPPEKAYNSTSVLCYSFHDILKNIERTEVRIPKNYQGIRGKIQQRGSGGYYLCRTCNSNTGAWYINEYIEFVKIISNIIQDSKLTVGEKISFDIHNCHPLKLFKSILTMFCDINPQLSKKDGIKDYLLNKESVQCDLSKYDFYMYLVNPTARRTNGFMAHGIYQKPEEITLISDVASYPIGLTMCFEQAPSYQPFGININHWANYSYDQTATLKFDNVPYVEITSQAPVDFGNQQID